jgi:hypothetical protein
LHEAAEHLRIGAWVSGSMTLLGAGLSLSGTLAAKCPKDAETLGGCGKTLVESSKQVSTLLGEVPRYEAEAAAKRAEAAAALAGTAAEQAERQRERVDQNSDRTLATIASTLESRAQGDAGVIAKVS